MSRRILILVLLLHLSDLCLACDPAVLLQSVNRTTTKLVTSSAFFVTFGCDNGLALYGSRTVYCRNETWDSDRLPVCASK